MLVIVNTQTGAKVRDLAAGDALLPNNVILLAPQAGMQRGDERIVESVEEIVGEGPIEEISNEAFDGEAWVVTRTRSYPPLAQCRAEAISQIDRAAETARLAFITDGAGQALVYRRKSDQARACLAQYDAQNQPPAGMFPALEAEVGITAADVVDVAATVVALEDAWAAIADAIEAIRLGAKRDVGLAPTPNTINNIVSAIVWPTPE